MLTSKNLSAEKIKMGCYSAQASYFAACRGIRDTKIEKSRGIQDHIADIATVLHADSAYS